MLSVELLALTLASLAPVTVLASNHRREFHNVHNHRNYEITARDYITAEARLESYDYIIAGGGLAGLVLAGRLSEDPATTVLVLEAGDTGDADKARIDTPASTYFESLLGGQYNYGYKTIPQPNAGNREMNWPRGKVLGGSATVNGMYLVRPSSVEIDTWRDLIADGTSSAYTDAWSWDSLYESMKKSETFTPPTAEAAATAGMRYNADSHGTSGPLQATYPAYMIPMTSAWLPTLAAAGVATSEDAYSGNNLGAFFSTMAINPSNWTRSWAKSAYIDNLPPRSNLHVLANAAVTKIVFADNAQDGNVVASGVEFAATRDAAVQSVQAKKEVILAGGAVGSPHMLLVSGVGPKAVLDEVNIPVKVDLPGVGAHAQDHLATGISWAARAETQGDMYHSGSEFSRTPEFLSYVNTATSYVNGSWLFDGDENLQNFIQGLKDTFADDAALTPLIPSTNPDIVAGYKTIYQAYVDKIIPNAGLIEMLFSINTAGRITIQAALQTPMSQGRLYINSTSIFDHPVLDPQYFSHPADAILLRQALKKVRTFATLSPMSDLVGEELSPGPDVQTDEDWENFARSSANTEFHPGCTCAMLPREKGGVVDASLKVYGTANVRVIDGSVFPLSMSAHLMAPIYGLAEKASELIANPPAAGSSSTGGSSTGGKGSTGGSNNSNGNKDNAAVSLASVGATWVAIGSVIIGALLSSF